MAATRNDIRHLPSDESGATAVEYGLVAALIAVAVIVAMTATGNNLTGLFDSVEERATTVFDEADV